MPLYPVSGCKFSIGTALDIKSTDFVLADFSAITYTEVGKWIQMGDYGDEAAAITTQIIGESRDIDNKGTRNAGTMQNIFASQPLDAGQIALMAALRADVNYAFRIELNDKPPTGASPKNSLRYFVGLVMSARETGGGANTIRNLSAMVSINSNVVQVAAAAS